LDVLKLDFRDRLPEITDRLKEIQQMLDQAVQQVRALSYHLDPAVVERAGLQSALERLAGRMQEQFSGSIRFLFDPSIRIPLPVANAWYKIAELALDNAIKHSGAAKIEMYVKSSQKSAVMEIRDNGSGFSISEAREQPSGLGLLLIEHYASQAAVSIDFKTAPGKGTVIRTAYDPAGERRATPADAARN
jgi:signal transduction histidine kinase